MTVMSIRNKKVIFYTFSQCFVSKLNCLITFAGFPTAIEFGGIDFVTTLFAPIMLFSPIVTPGRTEQSSPIQTLFSITTDFELNGLSFTIELG